jgi:hypothetical protein
LSGAFAAAPAENPCFSTCPAFVPSQSW